MKGDFTRSTFTPDQRFASVRMQQGRVQLDADWNEQVDIEEHLRETALADVIGRCGAPRDDHGGGFRIEVADGGANLTFSAGRIYVDGILGENGSTRRLTEQDEDHPGFALPEADGAYFVYLDVWRRHLTALEEPAIREVALGGPDTATRTRTTCQVKMVPVPAGSECPDAPDAWLDAVAAPSGTMRARTRPADFAPNPCVVPPSAGYTRLENQLYRVEVHAGGELGGAGPEPTFKWSRDNGSVVSRWLATSGAEVAVESLGRDAALTLEGARWVELTDDLDELNIEPGDLVEVAGSGENSLTVAPAPGAPDLARNAKVRRWDMPGPGGAVPIAEAPDDDSWTDLEGGIQVDFAPGTYRSGDYWLIPARAFIGEHAGDIEWPSAGGGPAALPPHGVEHHYCKLAVVVRSGGLFVAPVEDCRDIFCPLTEFDCPPAETGCCTVVVEPGGDVQAAIDSLPPAGGCVCLKTGEHPVAAPVRIARSNVSLHGESPGTIVRGTAGFRVLSIGDPAGSRVEAVRVEQLRFVSAGRLTGQAPETVVDLDAVEDVALVDCAVEAPAAAGAAPVAFGRAVRIARSVRVTVEECALLGLSLGIHVDLDSTALLIRDNRIWTEEFAQLDRGLIGIWFEDAFGASRIEGNDVRGYRCGIALNRDLFAPPSSSASGSVVTGNRVRRAVPAEEPPSHVFGIDVAAREAIVADNFLAYGATRYGGVRLSGALGRVEGNRLFAAAGRGDAGVQAVGIVVGWEVEEAPGLGDGAAVAGNRLEGFQDGIWVAFADQVTVRDNRLERPGGGGMRLGIGLDGSTRGRVAGNESYGALFGVYLQNGEGNRVEDNRVVGGFAALGAANETDLAVRGNSVADVEGPGFGGNALKGVTVVAENRFVSCAYQPAGFPPYAVGIVSDDFTGAVQVESNTVLDAGMSPDGAVVQAPAGGIGVVGRAATVHANRVFYEQLTQLATTVNAEGRALFVMGLWRIVFENEQVELFQPPAPAAVTDNSFHGTGLSALVEIVHFSFPLGNLVLDLGFGEVTCSANHCLHPHASDELPAHRTVALGGRRAVVVGNHVRSARPLRSFDFTQAGFVVYSGNFTTGGTLNANNFPAPENGHNRP